MVKCFLDFDHTLLATDRLFYIEVQKDVEALGIDPKVWQQAYEEIWSSGYSLQKHVDAVNRLSDHHLTLEDLESKLRDNLEQFVYPDVEPFLKRAKAAGVELYLLSFGSPEWQQYKVQASGLAGYFDDIFITATEGKKAEVIAQRADGTQIIMVDNNPEELDLVLDVVPGATTYLIERVSFERAHNRPEDVDLAITEGKRYLEKPSRHPHTTIQALDTIVLE